LSTDSLLEVMAQETAHRRAQILETARAEAARVLEAARDQAARQRDETVRSAQAELAELAQRARERAEAEAEMLVLTTKDRITAEILGRVSEELARIAQTPDFGVVLESLLDELLRDTVDKDGGRTPVEKDGERNPVEVVLAPRAHVDRCRRWLAAHGYGHIETRGSDTLYDGVAVQDARRSFRVSNTFTARLANQEGALRKWCLARLLGDGDGRAPADSDTGGR